MSSIVKLYRKHTKHDAPQSVPQDSKYTIKTMSYIVFNASIPAPGTISYFQSNIPIKTPRLLGKTIFEAMSGMRQISIKFFTVLPNTVQDRYLNLVPARTLTYKMYGY